MILDIDVNGALNVKKHYGNTARTIFIMPPSIEELRRRLEGRGTDSPDIIDTRIDRAEYEISFAPDFDVQIINDALETAIEDTATAIRDFIG